MVDSLFSYTYFNLISLWDFSLTTPTPSVQPQRITILQIPQALVLCIHSFPLPAVLLFLCHSYPNKHLLSLQDISQTSTSDFLLERVHP